MNMALSLPPEENLDSLMLKVARDIAMDIYELTDILKNNSVPIKDFMRWKDHPQFHKYIKSEKEAWNAATNAAERTKLKAGIVMEMFMDTAHTELHDAKKPLRDRTELAKVLSRIAGIGLPPAAGVSAGGPGGFRLSIVVNPTAGKRETINITAGNVVDHVPEDFSAYDDGYDPFKSPDTLEDL